MLQIGQSVSKKVVSIPTSELEFGDTGRTTVSIGNLRESTPEGYAYCQVHAPTIKFIAGPNVSISHILHTTHHFEAEDLKRRSPQNTGIDYAKAVGAFIGTLFGDTDASNGTDDETR